MTSPEMRVHDIIVVRGILRNNEGDLLLLKRQPNSKRNAGLWEIPGGQKEPGESLLDTIVRETLQETGLEVTGKEAFLEIESRPTIDLVSGIPDGGHYTAYAGLIEIVGDDQVKLSGEHVDAFWHHRGEPFEVDLAITTMNALHKYNQFGI